MFTVPNAFDIYNIRHDELTTKVGNLCWPGFTQLRLRVPAIKLGATAGTVTTGSDNFVR